jgi:hypothetical protein
MFASATSAYRSSSCHSLEVEVGLLLGCAAVIQRMLGERLHLFALQPFGRRKSSIGSCKPERRLIKNGYSHF